MHICILSAMPKILRIYYYIYFGSLLGESNKKVGNLLFVLVFMLHIMSSIITDLDCCNNKKKL